MLRPVVGVLLQVDPKSLDAQMLLTVAIAIVATLGPALGWLVWYALTRRASALPSLAEIRQVRQIQQQKRSVTDRQRLAMDSLVRELHDKV